MRLWSLHPRYLDAKGLVSLWREGLLAQNVLRGNTRGYQYHPQLLRFKQTRDPVGAIASYLRGVAEEAEYRDYRFDRSKIARISFKTQIPITRGQLKFEFAHLLGKLKTRAPGVYARLSKVPRVEAHPLFTVVDGGVEDWERIR